MCNNSRFLKISVAIASYNGEKFIKQQLLSILNQTEPVDEIIISDDGSSDQSLKIVRALSDSRIHLHKNKGRHGSCGNFENAISLCTGDLIFIADQDDVWDSDRVERTLSFLDKYPDAALIFCNGRYIDKNGTVIGKDMLPKMPYESEKLPAEKYLEISVSSTLANGMLQCITKRLSEKALPFPKSQGSHDRWLIFCALCEDHCYYLNEQLVSYRLHGNNATGRSKYAGNRLQQFSSVIHHIITRTEKFTDRVVLGAEMMKHLESYNLANTSAYGTAKREYEIGVKEMDAFQDFRIRGAFKLIHLYCSDIRYRYSGTKEFISRLIAILIK